MQQTKRCARCWMCDLPAEAWDHVKPLSKGGWHCLSNLRPACMSCNAKKRDTWPFTRRHDMATSPSQKWENGVMVERAIETNRWKILPDGTEVGEQDEAEAAAPQQRSEKAAKSKAIEASEAEDKSVKRAAKK